MFVLISQDQFMWENWLEVIFTVGIYAAQRCICLDKQDLKNIWYNMLTLLLPCYIFLSELEIVIELSLILNYHDCSISHIDQPE